MDRADWGWRFASPARRPSTDRIEQQFATPRWVGDAGGKGGFFLKGKPVGPGGPWEPVYDDPVFLDEARSRSLRRSPPATTARRGSAMWTSAALAIGAKATLHPAASASMASTSLERHVDLHVKHFRRTPLVISDDFVYSLAIPDDRRRLHAKLLQRGVSYRDDSILVDWYVQTCSPTFTVRSPEYFADAWPKTPTVLELEHYGIVKNKGNWTPQPGSSLEKFGGGRTGADYFRGAIEQLHATYIGYHGYAQEWLAENPALTVELLNRCGYWFFPHKVEATRRFRRRPDNTVPWPGRIAASRAPIIPIVCSCGSKGRDTFEQELPSGNTRWLPGSAEKTWRETYTLAIPTTLKPGEYSLKFKLRSREANRDVKLPLKTHLLDKNGFYTIAPVPIR